MKRIMMIAFCAALAPAACNTGRSGVAMTDELARLEKKLDDLELEYNRTVEERQAMESQLDKKKTVFEGAREAMARRDQLRAELEAMGYSPETAEAYATVAGSGDGQVRRDEALAPSENGTGGPPAAGIIRRTAGTRARAPSTS
jgi:hypothetical protein